MTTPSPQDRINIDGYILDERIEGLATIELAEPASTSLLRVGLPIAFNDLDEQTQIRYHGTVTSLEGDTVAGLLLERITMVQVIHPQDEKATFEFSKGPTKNRIKRKIRRKRPK